MRRDYRNKLVLCVLPSYERRVQRISCANIPEMWNGLSSRVSENALFYTNQPLSSKIFCPHSCPRLLPVFVEESTIFQPFCSNNFIQVTIKALILHSSHVQVEEHPLTEALTCLFCLPHYFLNSSCPILPVTWWAS